MSEQKAGGGQKGKRKWAGGGGNKAAKWRRATVDPAKGVKGVLVTCDVGKERQSSQETMNWMQELAAKLYPEEKSSTELKADTSSKSVSSLLEEELKELQAEAKGGSEAKGSGQRFEFIDMEVQGVYLIYINDAAIDPGVLVHAMLKEVSEAKVLRTRWSVRLLPVLTTCYTGLKELEAAVQPVLAKAFAGMPLSHSYAIHFNRRGKNKNLERMACIHMIARYVPSGHRVDLHAADVNILVDVLRRVTTVCVVTDYYHLKKYNVRAIADVNAASDAAAADAGSGDAAAGEDAEDGDAEGDSGAGSGAGSSAESAGECKKGGVAVAAVVGAGAGAGPDKSEVSSGSATESEKS